MYLQIAADVDIGLKSVYASVTDKSACSADYNENYGKEDRYSGFKFFHCQLPPYSVTLKTR